MQNISKTRFFLVVAGAVLFLAIVIAVPVYFQNRRAIQANEQRMARVAEDMKKNNPELYQNILNAIDENKATLEQDPNQLVIWNELGVNYQNIGNYIEAKKSYRWAIKISTETLIGWNNLADIYLDEKDYVAAEKTMLDQIKYTREVTAYIKLANLYASGKYKNVTDAVKILERGVKETSLPSLKDALQRVQLTGKL